MDLNELIDLALSIGITYFVVNVLIAFVRAFNKVSENRQHALVEKINNMVHQVKIEHHGEIEYWFDQDNDTFLGQGRTKEEIINVIKSRFPTHIFLLKGIGGVAAQTEWKLLSPEPFSKIEFEKELFQDE